MPLFKFAKKSSSSLLSFCACLCAGHASAAVLDPGWTESVLAQSPGSGSHTALAWAPDGSDRLFVLEKDGIVRVLRGATTSNHPTWSTFATLAPIHTGGDSGLLGLAFDPDFAQTQRVHFFVTTSPTTQRIVRYNASTGIGTHRTELPLSLPTTGTVHNGGGLGFGADGMLYVAIGDLGNGTGVDADLTSLGAKISRLNRNGTSADDNPFNDGVGPNNEYIWARGLRDPSKLAFQPATGLPWVNVMGSSYEQVFIVRRGNHAGYNDYENNQPATAPYITPAISYRSDAVDTRNIVAATRLEDIAMFSTSSAHGFRAGAQITIDGAGDVSFDDVLYVDSVPNATTFTAAQRGADVTIAVGGGTATTAALGGAIGGGAFYDATLAPADYRGNYFFVDRHAGQILRATLDAATNAVRSVDVWGNALPSLVDIAPGPDGALYYLRADSDAVYRAAWKAQEQGIVASNRHLQIDEVGRGVISVRLAMQPSAPVDVTVAHAAGDSDVIVVSGAALTFTAADWSIPRTVTIEALSDTDASNDEAELQLSSPGLASEKITLRVTDRVARRIALFADGFETAGD